MKLKGCQVNYDFICGLLLSLVAAGALISAYRLGIGALQEPGAGLIPSGTAALLCLMCGSTSSILVNIPGEASSVVTCLDGYQMARQGKAGRALGMAAFGSLIAGIFAIFGLMLLAAPLGKLALKFGPPEYFALMCMGLVGKHQSFQSDSNCTFHLSMEPHILKQ